MLSFSNINVKIDVIVCAKSKMYIHVLFIFYIFLTMSKTTLSVVIHNLFQIFSVYSFWTGLNSSKVMSVVRSFILH